MLPREENDLLTQITPGTPCGKLLRSYWQPAALREEIPHGAPPIPLQLFGEELVFFRDERGRVGLLDAHCAHRSTDLSYGRVEDGGLRCIYHGWLYDVTGKCLATPGEPPGSRLREQVRVQEGIDPPGVIRDPQVNVVDPILLKYNAPSSEADMDVLLNATGGRWVKARAG